MAVTVKALQKVRSGLKEQLPQLNGGEFGWCNDTLQLYIGNGSLEEGAPYVGNTLIATEASINPVSTATLADNTVNGNVAGATWSFTDDINNGVILNYKLVRGNQVAFGNLYIAQNASGQNLLDINVVNTGNIGVQFGLTTNGSNSVLQYTTNSTGNSALMTWTTTSHA